MITLSALNRRERIGLGACLFLLLFALFFRFIFKPTLKSFRELKLRSSELRIQTAGVEAQFSDIEEKRAILEQEKINADNLANELDKNEAKLFSQAQLGELLKKITQDGSSQKLNFLSITPKKKEAQGFYFRLPIEVRLSSPYSAFLDYLKELEKVSDVLKVKTVNIELDKAVSENPAVSIMLNTVLSDRPSSVPPVKKASVASSAVKLFTTEKPPVTENSAKLEGIELKGVIWKGGSPTAIINNMVVGIGSFIGKKKVVEITPEAVILEEGGVSHTLKILR